MSPPCAPNGGTRYKRTLQRVQRYLRDSGILQRWTKLPPVFTEPQQNIGCYQTWPTCCHFDVTFSAAWNPARRFTAPQKPGAVFRNKADVIDAVYVCCFKRVRGNQRMFCRHKVDVINARVYVCCFKRVATKLTLSMQSTFATSNVSAETRASSVATKLTLSIHSRHLLLQTGPQKPGAVLSQQSSRFGLGVRR